jgi:hypothetical protein
MTILEIDALTGKKIQRNATTAELDLLKADETKRLENITQAQTKAIAKAALLAQLGITEEQAKLLLN